ncbi:molecular chaperone [Volvox carteri f. nagariensis]|uniref:Molecular chaperone n=1 Tax=Volvox carteri f. nagariensis TaxID=3068 RepID=D8TGV9_VOLCA|nr:molecular chaperone [Volvox carteri f. nagariensis]EFJ53327.1 molecular chaperone [Volvox carteri f. nagariensis]|eukprot:XP_002946332.1 molecular chaperone [Volvox carteri f. nagariensis]
MSYKCSLPALMDRGVPVSVLEFEISASEAVSRFEEYQRKTCMYLHAHSLLKLPPQPPQAHSSPSPTAPQPGTPHHSGAGPGGSSPSNSSSSSFSANSSSSSSEPGEWTSSSLTAAYLPYWCFEATFNSLWAHQRPQSLRALHAAKQVRADFEFYKKYDLHETYGSGAASAKASDVPGSRPLPDDDGDYVLWLWADADWRRWELDEPWNWGEEERRKWAEELWRKQATRRLERQRFAERMAAEEQRRAAEEEAEARRQQKYGGGARSSYSRHRPRDHGMGLGDSSSSGGGGGGGSEAGEEEGSWGSSGGRRRRGRSDFLGYYRVLGLQDADAVSSEDIKQAFKVQALQLHPDKHVGAEPEVQRTALVKFQKLQIAYDTLKDAEKRRLYDRGQLVQ